MNYAEVKEYITRYLKARIPVIILDTVEKDRSIRLLKELSKDSNYNFRLFKMSEGITDLNTKEVINEENTVVGALEFISEELKTKQNMNYIISDISDINTSNMLSRFTAEIIERAESTSSTIILITNELIWGNISRLGISVSLNYPNDLEIQETIKRMINNYKYQIQIEWDDTDCIKAANCLQGLSEMEVKNIIASFLAKGSLVKTDLEELKHTKRKIFTKTAGLELIDTDNNTNIAGLDNLKKWINERKVIMDPSRKDELASRGISNPRGILLVGVPGCGKSFSAKVVANMFNYPLYRLDLATIQGEYVGQSERQLKEALARAEYMSPCVLWIDEIEKGLSESDRGGVTTKMIGQFLFWLQESKKPVFVIATANNVENLPAELIRKGRFDEIFFIDLPKDFERKELLQLYIKKYLRVEIGESLIDKLVQITEGFASADIEASLRGLTYKLLANKDLTITEDLLVNELSSVQSITKTNPEKVEAIRAWGRNRAISASK